ncbi:MAG: 2-hydroxyacyl-CoA dehydratase subunit D [Candidatus Helarchaeota archaeon]
MQNEKQFVLWDEILKFYEKAITILRSINPDTENEFANLFYDYFGSLRTYKKENKPIVMTNFCFPPELIYALDCYPMCQEIGSVALSIANASLKYIDKAEEQGIDKAQCNAQKVWIGASMLGEAPYPDYIVYGSQPCDSTNSQYQVIDQIYKVPNFTIDIPYWHYDPENEYYDPETIPYVSNQLKKLISWFENKLDRKMDQNRFIETIKISNVTRELILEGMELMKHKPAPLGSLSAFNNYAVLLTNSGRPETIKYAQWVIDTAQKRIKNNIGYMEEQGREEKHRILWIYLPIFFDPFLFDWIERKFGAIAVMDLMGYTMSQLIDMKNEDTIYEGLARQILDTPMGRQSRGPAEYYIDDLLRIGREYQVDCSIFGGHMGCKHSHAIAMLMKEIIEKELEIPCLTFEVDCIDSRILTSKELKKKLKVFFNSLD